jgi:hypothetical protein
MAPAGRGSLRALPSPFERPVSQSIREASQFPQRPSRDGASAERVISVPRTKRQFCHIVHGDLAPVLAKADGFSVTLRSRVTLGRASLELVRTSGRRSLTTRIVCRGWSPHLDEL